MTIPANEEDQPDRAAKHLVLAPWYEDKDTGELWVHQDYKKARDAYADDDYVAPVGPVVTTEKFGDLESWAEYLRLYGPTARAFITWNSYGLCGILDYHDRVGEQTIVGKADRAQWKAEYPFVATPEWRDWSKIATGEPIPHSKAVEFIDDHLVHIAEPPDTVLLNILRKLRSNSTAKAETELRSDGTAHIKFERNEQVTTEGEVDLPPEFEIRIPILRGHTGPVTHPDGSPLMLLEPGTTEAVQATGPVIYRLVVRLRVSIIENKLHLRFTLPAKERVLEQVYADMVAEAKTQLGPGFTVLRAAEP